MENVVDWAKWLESVEDAEIRKKSTPAVEKLKKQIAELWGEKLVVEKGKSAFGKFARQFIIRGDDSLSPQEFFRKARGEIKLLLRQNPQTKSSMHSECGNDSKSNWRRRSTFKPIFSFWAKRKPGKQL